jgi:hypothetical protein
MSVRTQRRRIQENFIKVGNVLVPPNNPTALKVIQAGAAFEGVVFNKKSSDERETVEAAKLKRERKNRARLV